MDVDAVDTDATGTTDATNSVIMAPLNTIEKMGDSFSTYGYPILRMVAALAVVWFSGAAPS